MQEPGEVVNVIDSFDDGAPSSTSVSLNISLGFDYSSKSAKILRETSIAAPGLTTGGFTTHLLNVASYSETTARLSPAHRPRASTTTSPRTSRCPSSSAERPAAHADRRRAHRGRRARRRPGRGRALQRRRASGTQAPTRSGLQYIAAGLDFDILDQARDRTKPTWLFGFEGRFSVGTPMHACNTNATTGQLSCANPSDVNRNGKYQAVPPVNGVQLEGIPFGPNDRGAGITRGTMALEVHTLMSKRIKYVEPYGGFTALFEFQQDSSDYGLTNLYQSLVNHPPLVGTMIAGMMIIPWENREKFGRLTFDLRFMGQYHSEGRDYSELFDALGSSAAPSLRQPVWAATWPTPTRCHRRRPSSVVDTGSAQAYTTGLSDVLAYGSYRGSASVIWQASEYVKFQFGVGYAHDQGHVITGDSPCNPARQPLGQRARPTTSGPCHIGDQASGQTNFGTRRRACPTPTTGDHQRRRAGASGSTAATRSTSSPRPW